MRQREVLKDRKEYNCILLPLYLYFFDVQIKL